MYLPETWPLQIVNPRLNHNLMRKIILCWELTEEGTLKKCVSSEWLGFSSQCAWNLLGTVPYGYFLHNWWMNLHLFQISYKHLFPYINQLDALNFIISLFQACTCFEYMCSSSGGQNCTIQSLVSSHSVGGRPVHGTATDRVMWWYQKLYNTILLSWRWAHVLETCRGLK